MLAARLRYVSNPLVSMERLSCTAMAVVQLQGPHAPGAMVLPAPRDLAVAIPLVVGDVERYGAVLKTLVSVLLQAGPPTAQVRVPLDVVRPGPMVVQWRPFGLLSWEVGRQEQLLEVFPLLRDLRDHGTGWVGLLVDEKVYTQVLRCVYGVGYQGWAFRRDLVRSPGSGTRTSICA